MCCECWRIHPSHRLLILMALLTVLMAVNYFAWEFVAPPLPQPLQPPTVATMVAPPEALEASEIVEMQWERVISALEARFYPNLTSNLPWYTQWRAPANRTLAVCTMIKFEDSILAEFIIRNMLAGVSYFIIYDNGVNVNTTMDFTRGVLDVFINIRVVEYIPWPSGDTFGAYNLCSARTEFKYMALLDADEFITQQNPTRTVIEHLDYLDQHVERMACVLPFWKLMQMGQTLSRPQRSSLTSSYPFRCSATMFENKHPKSIVKTGWAAFFKDDPHFCKFHMANTEYSAVTELGRPHANVNQIGGNPGAIHPTLQYIALNHYYGRSFEEWYRKKARGMYPNDHVGQLYQTRYFADNYARGCLPNVFDKETSYLRDLVQRMLADLPFHAEWIYPVGYPHAAEPRDMFFVDQINKHAYFDELYYLEQNPDVQRQVHLSMYASGLNQFYLNFDESVNNRTYRFHVPQK